MLVMICLATVLADRAPPDYGHVLAREAAARLEATNVRGHHADAVEWGEDFQEQVLRSADVEYEIAYAWNALGEPGRARRHFERAIELEPNRAPAALGSIVTWLLLKVPFWAPSLTSLSPAEPLSPSAE